MADTLLDVIDDNNDVIGQELRSIIHAHGLRHREIHIWFITPQKEIIFQKRGPNKEFNPNLLTVAVGGHVESGSSYEQTALIETEEETGLKIAAHELVYFMTYKSEYQSPKGNMRNVSMRGVFGYVFKGSVEDLKVEEGEGEGFIAVPLQDVRDQKPELMKKMSNFLIEREFSAIADKLEALVA